MYDLKTLFLSATALIRCRYAVSLQALGRRRGAWARICAGTVSSISWPRLSSPRTPSMSAVSSALGPICRLSNFSWKCILFIRICYYRGAAMLLCKQLVIFAGKGTDFRARNKECSAYLFDGYHDAVVYFHDGRKSTEKVNYNLVESALYFIDKRDGPVKVASDYTIIDSLIIAGRTFRPPHCLHPVPSE